MRIRGEPLERLTLAAMAAACLALTTPVDSTAQDSAAAVRAIRQWRQAREREVIKRGVEGCDGALVVLAPRGIHQYSSGTARAVLDYARPAARLVFSCGWHITRDGQRKVRALLV
jgi:hypothetical protein